MKLTDDQLHILRHMLGINTPNDKIPKPYRNYAAVDPGDPEFVKLEQLGAVTKYCSVTRHTQYDWYECTEEGKLMAIRSHRDIRHTRGQRRYHAFLDLCDVFPDMTFKDFLTHPDFRQVRESA